MHLEQPTTILIKSYNRAFYLDRCIQSIKKFVSGSFSITVLDDGTPKKYLDKIQQLHPEVIIKTSANYEEKSRSVVENIRSGKPIDGFQIPTDLWYQEVRNASDYFIITEDDVWFSAEVNIDQLVNDAKQLNTGLIKLGWLNNYDHDKWLTIKPVNPHLDATIPNQLFLHNKVLMDVFFYNRLKFFSLLYRLKLVDNQTKLKYWALNSIMMGLWEKHYWLEVWKDAKRKVDETQQLRNAATYYNKHKNNPNFLLRLKNEAMATTFQSSATNSYHNYGYQFDVNLFNHLINEAWLNGAFDAMQNFPKDFTSDYFESFIKDRMNVAEFQRWVGKFKEQYRNLGSVID